MGAAGVEGGVGGAVVDVEAVCVVSELVVLLGVPWTGVEPNTAAALRTLGSRDTRDTGLGRVAGGDAGGVSGVVYLWVSTTGGLPKVATGLGRFTIGLSAWVWRGGGSCVGIL